ncbi:MAG: DUF3073 domain-containing protein [Mycobacteriales bacterium]|nr:MAG: DUF3073 domain-containing protein [Pseudonocardiales bacterium]
MGRGRAKAKQTKVARALKYSSQEPDLLRLQRELSGAEDGTEGDSDEDADDTDDISDPAARG